MCEMLIQIVIPNRQVLGTTSAQQKWSHRTAEAITRPHLLGSHSTRSHQAVHVQNKRSLRYMWDGICMLAMQGGSSVGYTVWRTDPNRREMADAGLVLRSSLNNWREELVHLQAFCEC